MLPGREISAKLNLPVTQEVLHLKRIRNVNNEPIVLQESYVFAQGIEKVSTVDLRNQSLYKCLEEMCDEKIVKAHDVIEAIAAKGELCEALQIEEGFPVLSTSRLAYGKSGNPVELTYSLYRSDQYEGRNICIERVLHKTHISVTETGTKAGAASAAEMTAKMSMIPPEEIKTIRLDRPFLYMIIDCHTSTPVFLGVLHTTGC